MPFLAEFVFSVNEFVKIYSCEKEFHSSFGIFLINQIMN